MKINSRPGIALFLVMSIIFLVLTSVVIGAAVLMNNLDASRSRSQAQQAEQAAVTGVERLRGYNKADSHLFDGCTAGDCLKIADGTCGACGSSTMNVSGDIRYRLKLDSISGNTVAFTATGYRGPYEKSISGSVSVDHCGEILTDRDSYEYTTVRIGTQCWMATSLRTKTKADGTCINDGGTPPCADASNSDNNKGRSCYDDSEGRCEVEGALYTWDAAMDGSATEGGQGLCPDGWHVPSDAEWHTLEQAQTGEGQTCDGSRVDTLDCTPAGESLQQFGSSQFEALLAGRRTGGKTYEERGNRVWFWTSTAGTGAQARRFDSLQTAVYRLDIAATESLSLRCIMDE